MKRVFCTIITSDYINYALALNFSLLKYCPDAELKVFISDSDIDTTNLKPEHPNVEFFYSNDLCDSGIGKKIKDKYQDADISCFRWSMKSVFITYLLKQGFEQVFYLDGDLYFFSSFEFLYKELENNDVILTPHWRASNPHKDEGNFSILQTSGIYNAGFIGVNKNAIPAMVWWSNVCEFKCQKAPGKGLFADQAYLDLLPVYFDRVKVIRHKGCNVANWNQVECKRNSSTKGKVKINNQWDVVFIHFTQSTINGILNGEDGLLKPYLEEYQASLEKFKDLNQVDNQRKSSLSFDNDPKTTSFFPVESVTDENFISPVFTHKTLDRYITRSSIIKLLKHYLPYFSGTLLDVGCGEMPYKAFLTSGNSNVEKYIGLDLEGNPIHNNHPDITWQDGVIPLEDNSVDCAISTEVLEHCPDPEAILSEVCRVMKPGSLFFFTVPFLWPLHEVPYDEYRYTPYSLGRHLTNTGFVDIKLKPMGGWDMSMAQMLGLWVRRRPMRPWLRKILSLLLMPIIFLLIKKKNKNKTFYDGLMITGITGLAYKKD